MEQANTKTCTACQQTKDIAQFGRNRAQNDGLHYYCKACTNLKVESRKDKQKEWVKANKEKVKAYQQQYRLDNREKINEYQRSRPAEKKKKANCSEQKKQKDKQRRQDESYKTERKLYYKRKYAEDIQYRIRKVLEARFHRLLKKNDETSKSLDLIDCTIPEFKQYIECYFKPTMSWSNYGIDWQIDRIIPFCEFDLTDPDQVKDCFSYLNAQPLFVTTRVIDGVEYIGNLNKNKY